MRKAIMMTSILEAGHRTETLSHHDVEEDKAGKGEPQH
jgi:hypothetical protein